MSCVTLAISCTCLLLLLHSHITFADSSVRPASTGEVVDSSSNVVVKLKRGICDYQTGEVTAENLDKVKTRAAREGLQYVRKLRPHCWYVFTPAGDQSRTAAAIASLTPTEPGTNGDSSATAAGVGANISQPFAFAGIDASKKLWNPPIQHNLVAPLTARRRRRRTKGPAATTTAASSLLQPADYPEECPNGTCSQLWNMNYIDISDIWNVAAPLNGFARRGSIVDTGVDFSHDDFQGQLDAGRSATFNAAGNVPEGGWADRNLSTACLSFHGTHVMGTVAGGWGNNDVRGIAGIVGPAQSSMVMCNCFSMNPKSLPCDGTNSQVLYTDAAISDCLGHAKDVDAHYVINLSLGALYQTTNPSLQLQRDAIKQFICDNDGIVVAAAGNLQVDISNAGSTTTGSNYDGMFPANFASEFPDCVLAVAAVNVTGKLADFSNYGAAVQLAAPGMDILSDSLTYFDDNPASTDLWRSGRLSGTSMAAPHVTGVILVIRNAFPAATAAQVVGCLKDTATSKVDPPDGFPSQTIGGGLINPPAAYKCVQAAMAGGGSDSPAQSPPPTPPSSPTPTPPSEDPTPSPRPHRKPRRAKRSPTPVLTPSPTPTPTPIPPVLPPGVPPGRQTCPLIGLPRCVDPTTGVVVDTSACSESVYCKTVTANLQGLDASNPGLAADSWTCRYNLLPASAPCYPASVQGSCLLGSTCTGTSPDCPSAGAPAPDGTPCSLQQQQNNNNIGGMNLPFNGTNWWHFISRGGFSAQKNSLKVYCKSKAAAASAAGGGTSVVQQYLRTLTPTAAPDCTEERNTAAAAVYRRQRRQKATAAAVAVAGNAPKSAQGFGMWYNNGYNSGYNKWYDSWYNNRDYYHGWFPYTGFYMRSGQPLYDCGVCQKGQCVGVGIWRCYDDNDK